MQRTARLALSAFALVALTAACSSDGEQVADAVDEEAAKRLEVDTDDVTTTCPDDAEAGKGETFECTVDIEGQDLPASIEFTSDEDFTFEFTGEAFTKEVFVDGLKETLATEEYLGSEVTELTCPGETYVVIAAEETIECEGTDASGSEGTVVVGLDDAGDPYIVELKNPGE